MNKREARTTITDLAQECNRLEAENRVLREALSTLERRFFELVPLSCRLNADIMDQWFLLAKQLAELPEWQPRNRCASEHLDNPPTTL